MPMTMLPSQIPKSNTPFPQLQEPQGPKQRGIRSHNLIISCQDLKGTDPKTFVENLFLNNFHRKPSMNAVQLINRRTTNNAVPETDARGRTVSTDDSTTQDTKILVTLNSIWEARSIYRERVRALNNTGIYISEDLNREESYLFYLSRKLKRNNVIVSTWTENGEVYIKESQASSPRIVTKNDHIFDQVKEDLPITRQVTPKSPTPTSNPIFPEPSQLQSSQSEYSFIQQKDPPPEQEIFKTVKRRTRNKKTEQQDES
jgi:hypothetical protein